MLGRLITLTYLNLTVWVNIWGIGGGGLGYKSVPKVKENILDLVLGLNFPQLNLK